MKTLDKDTQYKPPFAPFKGCHQWSLGCLLILVLLIGFLCSLLTFIVGPKRAAANEQDPLNVWLLIDNSNSMFEKDGIGSDPDLLRLDAARLFLSYLGVDERDLTHQAGVIFFGTEAETAVPLTPLTDDQARADLFAQIAEPPRMGWTDHLAALQLAKIEIETSGGPHPALILLTDGKPEWPETMTEAEQATYLLAIQNQSAWFADAGIPLFIILLSNQTTDQDAAISDIWRPLWSDMSAAAPPGRFYVARTARDLPHIYHDVVVALTNEQTAGVVLETEVPEGGVETTLVIPDNLTQLTLVISKSDPTQQVVIETEDGQDVTATSAMLSAGTSAPLSTGVSPQIRHAGSSNSSAEEVWVFEQPPAGNWQVRVNGAGDITIWQDYKTLPVSALPPSASPTSQSTNISVIELVTPTPTATPAATTGVAPTVETAVITLITPPAPVSSPTPKAKPFNWPLLVLIGLFLAVIATVGGLWLYHTRQPQVSGTLRVMSGGQLVRTIDMDSLGKTAVSLGKPPADIPLAGATTTLTIVPGARLADDTRHMFLRSDGDITINGQSALPSTALTDATLIDLGGGIQLRYENLRLRRAGRLSAQDMNRKKMGEIKS